MTRAMVTKAAVAAALLASAACGSTVGGPNDNPSGAQSGSGAGSGTGTGTGTGGATATTGTQSAGTQSAGTQSTGTQSTGTSMQTGFVAHEWGTFTSVQSSTGETMVGMAHEDEPLPQFVWGRSDFAAGACQNCAKQLE